MVRLAFRRNGTKIVRSSSLTAPQSILGTTGRAAALALVILSLFTSSGCCFLGMGRCDSCESTPTGPGCPPPPAPTTQTTNFQQQAVGCFLQAGGSSASVQTLASQGQIYFPSGNVALDNFNQQEGLNLVNTYFVSPRMFYLVDPSPNAFATPEVVNAFGPDGTILFGQNLMAQQLSKDPSGASVIAVMAHEFAHLLQFRHGVHQPGKMTELHADFMAGWYLNLRGRFAWTNLMPTLKIFYELGDYQFNSPTHHGTPAERLQAAEGGFNSGATNAAQAYTLGAQIYR